ncbi:hypothetical protein [Flavobacterium sp.]|uniref:hypothetical protein n=1 Tax=Flavobacterium sp. TaxID=239 RepID=UPI0025BA882A|nr:hypothetical protein [Flavobacterium sp.]
MEIEKARKGRLKWYWWLLIFFVAILFIIAIILYYSSLGKVDLTKKIEKQLIKHNEEIDRRIEELEKQNFSKLELAIRLDQFVSWVFLAFRIIVSGLYILINIIIYLYCGQEGFHNRLSCVVNINEAMFLIFLLGSFLLTTRFSDVNNLIRIIHLRIRKLVYGRFKRMEEEAERIGLEISKLRDLKNFNKQKLEDLKNQNKSVFHKFTDI